METKRLIITVAVMIVLIFTWDRLCVIVAKQMGWNTASRTVEPDATTNPTSGPDSLASTTQPFIPGTSIGPTTNLAIADAGDAAKPVEIGSFIPDDATYLMGLSLSPRGAGLSAVTLNKYKKSVDTLEPYVYQEPYPGHEDMSRPLATRSVTIDGATQDISAAQWKLGASDAQHAEYTLDLHDAQNAPRIRLTKTFQLYHRDDTANGSGFEVQVTQKIENLTNHPMSVGTTFNGTTSPPHELERGVDRQIISGYFASADEIQLAHHAVEEFVKDKFTKDLSKGDNNAQLAWAGQCSVYFNAIVRPDLLKDPQAANAISKFTATSLDPASDSLEHFVTLSFDTAQLVPAGGSASLPLRVFFGPKQRSLLKSDYYSAFPLHYDGTLVMTGGPCSYCTSDTLINVLVKLLGFFHFIVRDWGLAIISLVILVRACLHPIMKRSQTNMMKMGQMGPEIERLKKKYGDDKDAMSKAQMELMKEQGFTPILGCLPMFLQMPIFIALWSSLQSTFELRQAPFLYFFGHHLTWIKDLAQPDKLIYFPTHPVSFFFIHFDAINLLPLLVAVVSFINQKVTPKPPAATPEAEQQQKMMQWMTLIFPLMFYNLPSGLNLYYVTSTSIGILEGKIIRRHIKEKEALAKGNRVIIDAKPMRASRQYGRDDTPAPVKKTGIMGWIANMQDKAEQIRKDAERGKEKK